MDSRNWHASTNLPTIWRSRGVSFEESNGMRTGLNLATSVARSGAMTRLLVSTFVSVFVFGGAGFCARVDSADQEKAVRIGRLAHARMAFRKRIRRKTFGGCMPGILPEPANA